jgi:hypothetical protein
MNTLKIGDRIRVQNPFNDYIVTVSRVTKTQAIAEGVLRGSIVTQKFKLNYGSWLSPVPKIKWDLTTYTLL